MNEIRPCAVCFQGFIARRKDARYCSLECHAKRDRGPRYPQRSCARCGEKFTPTAKRNIYCSRSCRYLPRPPKPARITQDNRSKIRRGYEDRDWPVLLAGIRESSEVNAEGCWIWQRRLKDGYPVAVIGTSHHQAHRLSLAAALGADLGSQPAHHKCGTTACVNPDHLQPVTHRDNVAEMLARHAYLARIRELESALADLDPSHELLLRVPVA